MKPSRWVALTACVVVIGGVQAQQPDPAPPPPAAAHPAKVWIDRALTEAAAIEEREERAEVIGTIAGAAAEAGDRDAYQRAIQTAMAAAKETDELTIGATMWSIAESQARAGDVDAAMATASHAGDPTYVALSYAAVAKALAPRGKAEDFQRVIAAATDAAADLNDPHDQGWALFYITEARLAAADLDGARQSIETCRDAVSRAEGLSAIAARHGVAGQAETGLKLIEQARALLEEARRTTPAEELYLDFGLAKLAEARASCGQLDEALSSLAELADPSPRSLAVVEIARRVAAGGDADKARTLLSEAVKLCQRVEEPYERANNWIEIARAKVDLGADEDLNGWIDGLATSIERAYASLGAANGLIDKHRVK